MSEVEVSRMVAAPVERVWEIFTDLRHAADRMSRVDAVEVVTPGGFKIGTTWRETRTTYGSAATEQFTITECERQRRYVAEADNKGTHYRAEYTFTPVGEKHTRLRVVADTQTRNAVGKLVITVLGGLVSRGLATTMEQDIEDLADFCEAPNR